MKKEFSFPSYYQFLFNLIYSFLVLFSSSFLVLFFNIMSDVLEKCLEKNFWVEGVLRGGSNALAPLFNSNKRSQEFNTEN